MGRQPTPDSTTQMMRSTGQRIGVVRDLLGLTQGQAAGLVGLTQSAWSKIEGGTRPLQTDVAIRIARKFRLTLDFLYLGESGSSVDPAIAANVASLRADLIRLPPVQPVELRGAGHEPKEYVPAAQTT